MVSNPPSDFYTHYAPASAPVSDTSGMPQPSGPLPQYPNDAAARAAGLQDWAFYLNSGGVQQLQGS